MLRGEIKLFLHPEMQMSLIFLCSPVFVVVLSRLLLFPALSLTSQIHMDINVHGVILGGFGVVDWAFYFTSCSSNSALKKMQLFVLQVLTAAALQNSWLIRVACTFSFSTFHTILRGFGLEGTLKISFQPQPAMGRDIFRLTRLLKVASTRPVFLSLPAQLQA